MYSELLKWYSAFIGNVLTNDGQAIIRPFGIGFLGLACCLTLLYFFAYLAKQL